MKNIYRSLVAFLSLIISLFTSAQITYSGFSDVSITLKSDTTTKSVLISNLLEDRVGDVSPIIGTAAWVDNNKKLQCRSLLSFDYGIMPRLIRPEQITEATLILKPVEILTTETVNGMQYPKFIVRRISEPWEDSMTSWLTQPGSNIDDEVIKSVPEHKKHKTVRIDVTEIVRNMFRYGNNGFMIRYEDSLQTAVFLSQWFASARYENEKLRPELLIRWSLPANIMSYPNYDIAELSRLPMIRTNTSNQQPVNSMPYIAPVPVVQQEPTPPPKPKQDNR
ncbi:MAG: DNRLRE domain-containing protein [Chitinophagaceae bacterium]|nr:DNRLRE domain-containing protein [Chitinophagaceae bacterium]